MVDEVANEQPKLQLDPNPSPAAESKDFRNPDEADSARAHELALITKRQGRIGGWIGSSEPHLTIAFIVIGIAGLSFVICLLGMLEQAAFADLAKFTGTIMMTVAGYVFGVKSTEKQDK